MSKTKALSERCEQQCFAKGFVELRTVVRSFSVGFLGSGVWGIRVWGWVGLDGIWGTVAGFWFGWRVGLQNCDVGAFSLRAPKTTLKNEFLAIVDLRA